MSFEIQPARHNHQPTHQQGTKLAGKAWPKMTKNANFEPNLVVFGQTSHARPITNVNKVSKFSPEFAFLSIAGSFGTLLVGWLVVVARGLYLARYLFTYPELWQFSLENGNFGIY